uniref:Uncharacterized protein n=1 Tax=Sphaerodactylus townsendi TaxID=933632 RepID=A0ACB8EAA5_9SAUR
MVLLNSMFLLSRDKCQMVPGTPGQKTYMGHSLIVWLLPGLLACTKPKTGSVRFAPNQTVEGSSSHVHFDEKLHDSVVMVTKEKDGNFLVKSGQERLRELGMFG